MYLLKIRKTVCFEHNVQEFVILYFGHLLVFQNFLITFCQEGPQMLHAKLRANWSSQLGGV